MADTTLREIDALSAEHAALTRLQYDALQKSSYAHMPKADADAYDHRLFRIIEIRQQLAKFRAEETKAQRTARSLAEAQGGDSGCRG
jgi:hypothetical protein